MELQLEKWLAQVEGGEDVLHEKEREVSRRETKAAAEIREEDRLMWLERAGEVQRGSVKLDETFWDLPIPEDPNASVRQALDEDRG